MKTDASQLEEVTVVSTGYNSLPRKDMVGAYTTVKAEDIMMPAYNSIDQMLQGKIPGMVVVNSSSRSGVLPKSPFGEHRQFSETRTRYGL